MIIPLISLIFIFSLILQSHAAPPLIAGTPDLLAINHQNASCPPHFIRDNIPDALAKAVLGPVQPIAKNVSSIVKNRWIGGYERSGSDILDHTFGCRALPLRRDRNYTHFTISGGWMHDIEKDLIPALKQYAFFNHTGIEHISNAVCSVTNCDTVGIAFYPVIVPTYFKYPLWVFVYGVAFSTQGNLVSNVSAIEVWDGSGLTKFTPRGHVWFSTLWFINLKGNLLGVTPIMSIFGGKEVNATTAFVTLESVNVQLLWLIPVLSLGSGTGGIRTHPEDSPMDMCSPSGIFARVSPGISTPAFGKIVEGYLGPSWFIFDNSVDLALHFQKGHHRGLQSLELRCYSDLVILNWRINRAQTQIQYLSVKEIERRKKSRLKEYACNCPDGYDERGVCKTSIGLVNQWAQDRNITTDMLTLAVHWDASIAWNLVGVEGVKFIFATPVHGKRKSERPFLVVGGKMNFLFVRNVGGYIDVQHPKANFTFTTKISGLFDLKIVGKSNTTSIQDADWKPLTYDKSSASRKPDVTMKTDGSLMSLNWELAVHFNLANGLKQIFERVHIQLAKILHKIRTSWNSLLEKIKHLRQKMKNLMSGEPEDVDHSSDSVVIFNRGLGFVDQSGAHLNATLQNLKSQLDIEHSRNPLALFFMNGGSLPNLSFDHDPISFKFTAANDTMRKVDISVPSFKLNNQSLEPVNLAFSHSIDFQDPQSVEDGFAFIAKQSQHLYQTSLFKDLDSNYVD